MTECPPCRNVSKKTKDVRSPNGRARVYTVLFMIVTLFFWYLALNIVWYFLYNTTGFTIVGSLWGAMVSVISGTVYAYLLYEIIKPENFNLRRSLILVSIVVALAVIVYFTLPIPFSM